MYIYKLCMLCCVMYIKNKTFIFPRVLFWFLPNLQRPKVSKYIIDILYIIFLSAIWLSHGQLWAIVEEAASLTRC